MAKIDKAFMQTVNQLATSGQHREAFERIRCVAEQVRRDGLPLSPKAHQALEMQLWRLAPAWWANVSRGEVSLQRLSKGDEAFFRQAFSNITFKDRYARGTPWHGDLARALDTAATLPPADQRALHWIVRQRNTPVGLACLSSLDLRHRRAELSIGFPQRTPSRVVATSFLLAIHFSLYIVNLHKLYAHVYEDNTQALSCLERLGWHREGSLLDQYHFPGTGYVSAHVYCITKAVIARTPPLLTLADRLLNVDWRPKTEVS